MTTYPPERIVVDAEFVDDDEPTVQQPPRHNGGDDQADEPGTLARIATFLSATATRQVAHTRDGYRVLRTERGAWFNSELLTDAHVRADLLNTWHAEWDQEKNREAQRLVERAEALEKSADEKLADGRAEGAEPADAKAGIEAAAQLRGEAVMWRGLARQAELAPYTGHREPSPSELVAHRKRMGNRRRWKTVAVSIAAGWGILQVGSPILLASMAVGLAAIAWGKGRFSSWRSAPPEVPALDYQIPAQQTGPGTNPAGPAGPAAPGFTKPTTSQGGPGPVPAPDFTATWTPAPEYTAPGPAGPGQELECPETDQLMEAMIAAGAISDGPLRLAHPGAITRVSGGWLAHVVLPKGDGVTVETVLPKLGKIAGEMGLDRARFFMDPVHASAGGHAKMIAVAAFEQDPFTEPRRSPLVDMDQVDVWENGIPVAFDAFGDLVNLILKDTSLSLGGASRTGKGAALRAIMAGALLDMRVNLRLIDGKAPGQDRWRDLAASFIDEPGVKGAKRARILLEALVEDLARRAAILKRYGMEQIDDPKLIAELGGLELVVVDELQELTGDKKHGAAIRTALSSLAARGLAFGIILIVATQVVTKGADGVLPRMVSGNVTWKWCMRVTETTESNMALSQSAAKNGWDASLLDPDVRGMGILLAERYRRVRSLWIDGADMIRMLAKITQLRTAAGRMRGQWADPIEAAMRRRGAGTPPPGHAPSPTYAAPADSDTGFDDGLNADAEDWEDGEEGDGEGEYDDTDGAEYDADGVPILLLRAHDELVRAGGRLHSGPLAALLGYGDVRQLGTDLLAYLKAVGVERPAGGQLRVPGAGPGLGYLAETLATAIDRYRTGHDE
ncbi:FtsK/SpoIIIE domain-containing protein [Kitasatospora sp. NPDC051853]|uniref:FtsK/SpoIIIE domain-containing protein n=1 Tax=Kitasatospora sp. NPDC051853 TaxID=3364058 RepID=UPI0037873AB6